MLSTCSMASAALPPTTVYTRPHLYCALTSQLPFSSLTLIAGLIPRQVAAVICVPVPHRIYFQRHLRLLPDEVANAATERKYYASC